MAGLVFGERVKNKITMKITYFNSKEGLSLKNVEVQEVLQQIQTGYWKDQINDIRYHMKNKNSIGASEIKSNLPAITISATFKERRKIDCVDLGLRPRFRPRCFTSGA